MDYPQQTLDHIWQNLPHRFAKQLLIPNSRAATRLTTFIPIMPPSNAPTYPPPPQLATSPSTHELVPTADGTSSLLQLSGEESQETAVRPQVLLQCLLHFAAKRPHVQPKERTAQPPWNVPGGQVTPRAGEKPGRELAKQRELHKQGTRSDWNHGLS